MNGLTAYALSKKYTEQSLDGVGALKGAPCTIKSTAETDEGTIIVFEWIGTSGTTETKSIIIKNGEDGKQGNGVIKVEKIKTVGLVDTYRMTFSDGATFDYEVTNGDSGGSTEENQIIFSKLADFPVVGEPDKVYIDTETSKSYIFTNNNYQPIGGNGGNAAWSTLT